MLISLDTPLLYIALRIWDEHDQLVRRYTWFNTDTMYASVVVDEAEQRTRISRFEFHAFGDLGEEEVRSKLPENLYDKIVRLD